MAQFMNMDIYACSNCDYQGSFFIEFEIPADGQEPELNKVSGSEVSEAKEPDTGEG